MAIYTVRPPSPSTWLLLVPLLVFLIYILSMITVHIDWHTTYQAKLSDSSIWIPWDEKIYVMTSYRLFETCVTTNAVKIPNDIVPITSANTKIQLLEEAQSILNPWSLKLFWVRNEMFNSTKTTREFCCCDCDESAAGMSADDWQFCKDILARQNDKDAFPIIYEYSRAALPSCIACVCLTLIVVLLSCCSRQKQKVVLLVLSLVMLVISFLLAINIVPLSNHLITYSHYEIATNAGPILCAIVGAACFMAGVTLFIVTYCLTCAVVDSPSFGPSFNIKDPHADHTVLSYVWDDETSVIY